MLTMQVVDFASLGMFKVNVREYLLSQFFKELIHFYRTTGDQYFL